MKKVTDNSHLPALKERAALCEGSAGASVPAEPDQSRSELILLFLQCLADYRDYQKQYGPADAAAADIRRDYRGIKRAA